MRKVGLLLIILIFPIVNISVYFFFLEYAPLETLCDADRLPNGNTLICDAPVSKQKVLEMDSNGKVVWGYYNVNRPHDADLLPNGNILIADTANDRIIELNKTTKEIVWQWHAAETNWTELNPNWGPTHYYNNPATWDWTHLNDVDYFPETDTILTSLRDFDLILELNKSTKEVIWHYGDFGNHSLLKHQHNPDKLPNGNIIIADSGNDRVIIINYTTKEIVWNYDRDLQWARDADYLNETGTILITDSGNNRVLEVTMEKEIVWEFRKTLILPYEADLLENGHILIPNGVGNTVLEVDRDGEIIWSVGIPWYPILYFINISMIVALIVAKMIGTTKQKGRFRTPKNYWYLFMMGLCIWVAFLYTFFLAMTIHWLWINDTAQLLEKIFGRAVI